MTNLNKNTYTVQIVIPPLTRPFNVYYDTEIDRYGFDAGKEAVAVSADELPYIVSHMELFGAKTFIITREDK